MFGLAIVDIIVIIAYFTVTILIGIWAMRRIKNQEDYFLAGRRVGKIVQIFAAFGQATSASNAVSATTTTMANGISGVWSALNYVFGTPVYWFTAVWYRRLRLLTMGDFFEDRYDSKWIGGIYAVISALGFMLIISLGVNAMGKTVQALTPKSIGEYSVAETAEYNDAQELTHLQKADYSILTDDQRTRLDELRLAKPRNVFSYISKEALVVLVCIVVMLYAVAGGLEAAFMTDMIQGFFIIVLSVLMIPFGMAKVNAIYGGTGFMGAMRTLHQWLPEAHFQVLGTPRTIDFTWYYILGLTVMVTINLGVQANQLVCAGSAKDEFTARFGFSTGIYLKRFCTLFWGLFGLIAVLLYSQSVRDPDLVYGHAILDLLGPLNLGLVGLMIACLMAAVMSTADCLMITSSSLLTHNLFRVVFPDLAEKHYVRVGRVVGALVLIGGCYVALQFESIFQQLKLSWEITAVFAASFWLGMLWRRANRKAAWSSIAVTLVLFFLIPVFGPVLVPGLRTSALTTRRTNPAPLERTYVAHEMDVQAREKEIVEWDGLETERPEPLEVGDKYHRTYQLPRKSIFWTQGVTRNDNGDLEGHGMLNVGLLAIDRLGWDMSKNSYAFNETMRLILRIVVPFGALILVALFTKPLDKALLDRFYVKMKTPVLPDSEEDEKELALSYANPSRFDHLKLFRNSNWEFGKWDKLDTVGLLISCSTVVIIVGLLFVMVSIGA
jgi:SSS family solute:Na+ symporter